MVMTNQIKFKIHSMRTLASPYKRTEKDESAEETIYYLLVNMKDLPEDIPLDVNPRVPKMGTNVAKRLVKAVTEPETDFYINNRGIIIAAKSLSFNSIESEVTIDIGNLRERWESPFQDSEESKALSMLKAELRQNFLKTRLNIQSQADTFIQFTVPFVLF